jgi:hypothetical protein
LPLLVLPVVVAAEVVLLALLQLLLLLPVVVAAEVVLLVLLVLLRPDFCRACA